MIESYQVGQRLVTEDFADEFYLPSACWTYAEVDEITDEAVRLHYVNEESGAEDYQTWTRSEMETMLGWSIDEGGNVLEVIDERAESDSNGLDSDILNTYPTDERIGSYELLRGPVPCFIRVQAGMVRELHLFDTHRQARARFEEVARG